MRLRVGDSLLEKLVPELVISTKVRGKVLWGSYCHNLACSCSISSLWHGEATGNWIFEERSGEPWQCTDYSGERRHLMKIANQVFDVSTLFDKSKRFAEGKLTDCVVRKPPVMVNGQVRHGREDMNKLRPGCKIHFLPPFGKSIIQDTGPLNDASINLAFKWLQVRQCKLLTISKEALFDDRKINKAGMS